MGLITITITNVFVSRCISNVAINKLRLHYLIDWRGFPIPLEIKRNNIHHGAMHSSAQVFFDKFRIIIIIMGPFTPNVEDNDTRETVNM